MLRVCRHTRSNAPRRASSIERSLSLSLSLSRRFLSLRQVPSIFSGLSPSLYQRGGRVSSDSLQRIFRGAALPPARARVPSSGRRVCRLTPRASQRTHSVSVCRDPLWALAMNFCLCKYESHSGIPPEGRSRGFAEYNLIQTPATVSSPLMPRWHYASERQQRERKTERERERGGDRGMHRQCDPGKCSSDFGETREIPIALREIRGSPIPTLAGGGGRGDPRSSRSYAEEDIRGSRPLERGIPERQLFPHFNQLLLRFSYRLALDFNGPPRPSPPPEIPGKIIQISSLRFPPTSEEDRPVSTRNTRPASGTRVPTDVSRSGL